MSIKESRRKMGAEAVHTIMKNEEMELVAALDYKKVGNTLASLELFPVNHCT